jgi:hypothetical protein
LEAATRGHQSQQQQQQQQQQEVGGEGGQWPARPQSSSSSSSRERRRRHRRRRHRRRRRRTRARSRSSVRSASAPPPARWSSRSSRGAPRPLWWRGQWPVPAGLPPPPPPPPLWVGVVLLGRFPVPPSRLTPPRRPSPTSRPAAGAWVSGSAGERIARFARCAPSWISSAAMLSPLGSRASG